MTTVQQRALDQMHAISNHRLEFGRGCEFKIATARVLERRGYIQLWERIGTHNAVYELTERELNQKKYWAWFYEPFDFSRRMREDTVFADAMLDRLKSVRHEFSDEEYMMLYLKFSDSAGKLDVYELIRDFLNLIGEEAS